MSGVISVSLSEVDLIVLLVLTVLCFYFRMPPIAAYLNHTCTVIQLSTCTCIAAASSSSLHHSMEAKMIWLLMLAILLPMLPILFVQASQVSFKEENGVKTAVYLSPKFEMGAGSVAYRLYYNVDFPRGHIGLKSFNAEVVDEAGNPVPLHQTYLHHWVLMKYSAPTYSNGTEESNAILMRNSGVCQNSTLGQQYGLGSETRRTETNVPDPYAIEAGNAADVPQGHEERWVLNVHAIDTRGVVDRMGCTECRCDLYNMTVNGYIGGLRCCPDQSQCRLIEGFQNVTRDLYLRYTVKWVDWVDTIVPVRVYILDVTDSGERASNGTLGCQVEYNVDSCGASGRVSRIKCLDRKKSAIVMPRGGNVVYGVAHQHYGGIGSSLYGEDGRKICSSKAIYGNGTEAGNESGYIVGMTTCYPRPGTVKISNGETLHLNVFYNSTQLHTGVMGLFYLLIADNPSNTTLP